MSLHHDRPTVRWVTLHEGSTSENPSFVRSYCLKQRWEAEPLYLIVSIPFIRLTQYEYEIDGYSLTGNIRDHYSRNIPWLTWGSQDAY